MIKINLLPEEMREKEHTPYPRLLSILIGLVLFLVFSYLAFSEFQNISEYQQKIVQRQADIDLKVNAQNKVKALKIEIEQMKKRKELVIQIVRGKMLWSRKLDQFNSMVEGYPNLWFDNLTIKTSKKDYAFTSQFMTEGHLMMEKAEAGVVKIGDLQEYLRDPKKNKFSKDLNNEKFKIGIYDYEYNPEINKKIVNFPFRVTFLPREAKKEKSSKKK